MSQQLTFSMIKPDATGRALTGEILQKIESQGLRLKAGRWLHLDPARCREFYQEHREKSFFPSLVAFILSGPVFVMALAGDNAVEKLRKIMGATNPREAEPGTIRALYGESIERNSIHGSDSLSSAQRELALFFQDRDLR